MRRGPASRAGVALLVVLAGIVAAVLARERQCDGEPPPTSCPTSTQAAPDDLSGRTGGTLAQAAVLPRLRVGGRQSRATAHSLMVGSRPTQARTEMTLRPADRAQRRLDADRPAPRDARYVRQRRPRALAPARLHALRAAVGGRRPRAPRPQNRLLPRRPLSANLALPGAHRDAVYRDECGKNAPTC